MRAVILNFTGQRSNWGCQATSWGLLRFLEDTLRPIGVTDFSIVPLVPRHVSDSLIDLRHGDRIAATLAAETPSDADLKHLERLVRQRLGPMVERVTAADLVFFQGEGTMGASSFYRRLDFFALPVLAKHLWRKPVLSLNQSFVAETAEDAARARTIFAAFDLVALREHRSYSVCRELGLDRALLCPDLAFRAPDDLPKTSDLAPRVPYFCISGSAALRKYNLESYLGAIRCIAETQSLRPVFLYSRPVDARLADYAAAHWPTDSFDVISSAEAPSYRDVLPVLAGAALVLGGRYHTTVSALAEGTPVVVTAGNSYKSEGLTATLGLELPVIDHSDAAAIEAAVATVCANAAETRADIQAAVGRAQASFDLFGGYLQALIPALLDAKVAPPALPSALQPEPKSYRSSKANTQVYRSGARHPNARTKWQLSEVPRAIDRLSLLVSMARNRRIYDLEDPVSSAGP